MAFEVHCAKCGARFTLPDDLYERKVRGRVVTVRCKKCRADINVDGTNAEANAKHDAALELTPTVPLSGPGSLPAVGGLWVVSFGDDDDRELTIGQLKKALEKGEINRETLVWNVSLDEWLTIAEVPALADLIAPDEVGGFLGTGVAIGSEPNELLGEDEIGPFRSVGAGTMSDRAAADITDAKPTEAKPKAEAVEAKAEAKPSGKDEPETAEPAKEAKTKEPPAVEGTPTLPLAMPPVRAKSTEPGDGEARPEQPSKPPPKPSNKKLPTAPVKARPAWLSDTAKPPATEDPDLPEGEEAAPSSGTPDLRSLMTGSLPPPKEPEPGSKDESVSEDIFAIGGGGIAAALPTIDLTNIEPPPPSSDPKSSRRKRDDDSPASSDRPRAKSKKAEGSSPKGKRPPPAPSARDSKPAKAAAAEEEKSGSPAIWLVLAGVAAVAVYWFFIRNPEGAATTEPTARPTTETRTEVTQQPTLAPPPVTTQAATPEADAATTAQSDAEVTKKEEKPGEKLVKTEAPTGKEEKPAGKEEKPAGKEEKPTGKEEKPAASAATGGDVAMAAPFDANAARSALNSAAGAASGCRQEGDPAGTATVVVTFAPSGRVTSANISGPPFAGTKTGGCIAAAMRGAKVPAFSGEHVTVSKTVVIQ